MTSPIGRMRNLVDIREPDFLFNSSGEKVDNGFTIVTQAWVEIIGLQGIELFEAQSIHPEANTSLFFRWHAGLTAEMNILTAEGGVLQFVEPPRDPDGRRKFMQVRCREQEA